ncbi:phosphoinositide-3-kinase, regulatory subunit 4, partial [Ilyodon furcidens]
DESDQGGVVRKLQKLDRLVTGGAAVGVQGEVRYQLTSTHRIPKVARMVQREPDKRLTAEEYLKQQRGKAFPDIFYTFLQPYMAQFAKETFQSADERVLVIRKDLDNILLNLRGGSSSVSQDGSEAVLSSREEQGLVVLVSVITSCLQTLHSCDSKLAALELVLHLAPRLGVDILLDRITPYLLHFCNDPVPRVRAQAVRTLTKVLALVKEVPRNDVNIYPEYLLPGIAHLAQDDATIVRLAYAENIAHLAESALRFLELVQENNVNTEQDPSGEETEETNHPNENYDSELQALHEMVQQKVVTLLSDSENIVKQTLMENGITRLCVFFGRQKANDVLLSHMITFLNDKNDWHLRGAFFDSIVGVAAYVGWQSSSILKPLLQQGLSDTEEFVIYKALNALTCMCHLGLLQKPHIYEFVSDIGKMFSFHPLISSQDVPQPTSTIFRPAKHWAAGLQTSGTMSSGQMKPKQRCLTIILSTMFRRNRTWQISTNTSYLL